jgi:hypothetical protein
MSHLAHSAKGAIEIVKNLEPLKEPKNAALAFFLGFLFGPFGIGIYFKSGKDFAICFAMLMVGVLFFGFGAIPGWLFSACYGAWRAQQSCSAWELGHDA